MKIWKVLLLFSLIIIIIGMVCTQPAGAQYPFGPLGPQWGGYPFYPFLPPLGRVYSPFTDILQLPWRNNFRWGYPYSPLMTLAPSRLSPLQRAPNATIVFTSPTLTAINTAPGIITIGATGVLATPSVIIPSAVVPTAQTSIAPAPAPLFSILAVLYASALLDPKTFLSTANPLLFAYLSTLIL